MFLRRGSAASSQAAPSLMVRLGRDVRGNTLAIFAAALVPIAGFIGSGLDMGRAYMTKSKLQNACDSAALAARRQMGSGRISDAARTEGRRFFDFNFPAGTMDAQPVVLAIGEAPTDFSVVQVSATTAIPTTIMRLFGTANIPLEVSCSADKDYVNNDIMVVLDVTLSMNCTAGSTRTACTSKETGSRVERLRTATAALYGALEDATGVRTRYGFMPYSMIVNVGRDLDRSWLRDPQSYHRCTKFQNNDNTRRCETWVTEAVARAPLTDPWFSTSGSNRWNGCVEERSTVSQNGQAAVRITTDVARADIDSVSTTDNRLKWQPYDPVRTVNPQIGNTPNFCPAAASKLREYGSRSNFQSEVDRALAQVGGSTSHDLGMMWALRYLSGTGMFGTENPDTFNQIRVDRHIVFMTDGEIQAPQETYYSGYGVRAASNRLIPTSSGDDATEALRDRFHNACRVGREMGITIWIIAVDVRAPGDIRPCATDENHFYQSDGSDLDTIFTQIGRGIGRLRMTQ